MSNRSRTKRFKLCFLSIGGGDLHGHNKSVKNGFSSSSYVENHTQHSLFKLKFKVVAAVGGGTQHYNRKCKSEQLKRGDRSEQTANRLPIKTVTVSFKWRGRQISTSWRKCQKRIKRFKLAWNDTPHHVPMVKLTVGAALGGGSTNYNIAAGSTIITESPSMYQCLEVHDVVNSREKIGRNLGAAGAHDMREDRSHFFINHRRRRRPRSPVRTPYVAEVGQLRWSWGAAARNGRAEARNLDKGGGEGSVKKNSVSITLSVRPRPRLRYHHGGKGRDSIK